jgi:hypothetical protein
MLDVESAAEAGIDLDRLLWIRGFVVPNPGLCRDLNSALVQAIRAFKLVLQAGQFGLVVFDAGEAPADAIRRLPFTTWLRLQRMVEGTQTACLLVGSDRMARSPAGLTLHAPELKNILKNILGTPSGDSPCACLHGLRSTRHDDQHRAHGAHGEISVRKLGVLCVSALNVVNDSWRSRRSFPALRSGRDVVTIDARSTGCSAARRSPGRAAARRPGAACACTWPPARTAALVLSSLVPAVVAPGAEVTALAYCDGHPRQTRSRSRRSTQSTQSTPRNFSTKGKLCDLCDLCVSTVGAQDAR